MAALAPPSDAIESSRRMRATSCASAITRPKYNHTSTKHCNIVYQPRIVRVGGAEDELEHNGQIFRGRRRKKLQRRLQNTLLRGFFN